MKMIVGNGDKVSHMRARYDGNCSCRLEEDQDDQTTTKQDKVRQVQMEKEEKQAGLGFSLLWSFLMNLRKQQVRVFCAACGSHGHVDIPAGQIELNFVLFCFFGSSIVLCKIP